MGRGVQKREEVRSREGFVDRDGVLFMTANALWEYYSYRVSIGGVDASREAWLRDLLILGSEEAREVLEQG
jgi:hypothetical protein